MVAGACLGFWSLIRGYMLSCEWLGVYGSMNIYISFDDTHARFTGAPIRRAVYEHPVGVFGKQVITSDK